MLGVGMPGISDVEGRSQFSLWCILAAPLFLGTNILNMSDTTLATIGNAEAIAINQDGLGVQGYAAAPGGTATSWNGGVLLNLTSLPTPAGAGQWSLSAEGNVVNAASGQVLTIAECDTAPGQVAFAWVACNNTCGNELWSWEPASGALRSRMQGGGALCLAGVDPSAGALSQLVTATCAAGAPEQVWAWGADGRLSLAAFGGVGLQQLAPPTLSLYVKPLLGGDVALALLNRAPAPLAGGTMVDLTALGFAPATRVSVRDVWAAATEVHAGNFTTRAIDSHETLLLRLSLA